MSELAQLSITDSVAHLELNRPKQHNALDFDLASAVAQKIEKIAEDKAIRALAITGRGKSFCVGGDLAYFVDRFDNLTAEFDLMVGLWQEAMQQLAQLSIPVIVGAQGGVGGGGLGFLWGGDHIIVADNVRLATGFVDIGVSGDGGNSWHLPRRIGMQRAKEMLIENRKLDANTAYDWGLVNRIVPVDALEAEVLKHAKKLSSSSLTAISAMKSLLMQSTTSTLDEQLKNEHRAMLVCASKEDIRTGMSGFIKGKKAIFTDC